MALVTSKKLTIRDDEQIIPVSFMNVKITSSYDANKILREFIDPCDLEIREEFHVLILGRSNNVIGHSRVSIGGTSGTVADGKQIFSTALLCAGVSSLILMHNHPSNQLTPSNADINLTKKLVEFGKLIDLNILDHLILGKDSYLSMADEGTVSF